MNPDEARAFVADNHRAVMATRRRDGGLQLSPVVVTLGEQGRVVVSSRETAMKVRNVRRDPRTSLCVLSDAFFGPWIRIDGQAEVLSLPEAMEPLVAYYRSVQGEHPDWDEYRAAMRSERRVLIRVGIEQAGPDVSG